MNWCVVAFVVGLTVGYCIGWLIMFRVAQKVIANATKGVKIKLPAKDN